MPAFAKNPKFIIGTVVGLWLAYVIYSNLDLQITVKLVPLVANLGINVSAVIVASAIFGSAMTLIIQMLWRRRSSKNASPSI